MKCRKNTYTDTIPIQYRSDTDKVFASKCWSEVFGLNYLQTVRSGNRCKPRGPCVRSITAVSVLISSFKLLAHPSSLVSWGSCLFVPYSRRDSLSRGAPALFTDPISISLSLSLSLSLTLPPTLRPFLPPSLPRSLSLFVSLSYVFWVRSLSLVSHSLSLHHPGTTLGLSSTVYAPNPPSENYKVQQESALAVQSH